MVERSLEEIKSAAKYLRSNLPKKTLYGVRKLVYKDPKGLPDIDLEVEMIACRTLWEGGFGWGLDKYWYPLLLCASMMNEQGELPRRKSS